MKSSDAWFLQWLAERLVFVYHESEQTDFVIRLKELAKELGYKPEEENDSSSL